MLRISLTNDKSILLSVVKKACKNNPKKLIYFLLWILHSSYILRQIGKHIVPFVKEYFYFRFHFKFKFLKIGKFQSYLTLNMFQQFLLKINVPI